MGGACDWGRTSAHSLEGCCSAVKLHTQISPAAKERTPLEGGGSSVGRRPFHRWGLGLAAGVEPATG